MGDCKRAEKAASKTRSLKDFCAPRERTSYLALSLDFKDRALFSVECGPQHHRTKQIFAPFRDVTRTELSQAPEGRKGPLSRSVWCFFWGNPCHGTASPAHGPTETFAIQRDASTTDEPQKHATYRDPALQSQLDVFQLLISTADSQS